MKYVLIHFLLLSQISFGQVAKIDQKFGFRDIRLESTFEEIQSSYTLEKIPNTNKYKVRGLEMVLDNLPIKVVILEFFKGKLYSIYISIDCQNTGSKVTEMIEKSYGKLKQYYNTNDYHIIGQKTELIYERRGHYQDNGSLSDILGITIRSIRLKGTSSGKSTDF